MRSLILATTLLFLISSFQSATISSSKRMKNSSFTKGEKLTYRLHYGLITAGEATVNIQPEIKNIKGKSCYNFTIKGKTTGAFATVMNIQDQWQSYVDTTTLYPIQANREIKEAGYYIKEKIDFSDTSAKVTWEKRDKIKKEEHFTVPKNIHDIVSAYYFLRNIDYSNMKKGERTSVKTFFEDKLYDFEVEYQGKDVIKTKIGKVNAIKLTPVMPENNLFEGGNSIQFWLSDDDNKIPLKVKAKMFVGAVEVDIKSYDGLRHDLNLIH
jgi:hypothetical protein